VDTVGGSLALHLVAAYGYSISETAVGRINAVLRRMAQMSTDKLRGRISKLNAKILLSPNGELQP
jgi:hypothetical protein